MEVDNFERLIVENEGADTARLAMSRREWPVPGDPCLAGLDSRGLVINTIESRRRLRKKVPEWAAEARLVYPSTLCAEQCSSSDTARYKASIAAKVISEYAGAGASAGSENGKQSGASTGSATDGKGNRPATGGEEDSSASDGKGDRPATGGEEDSSASDGKGDRSTADGSAAGGEDGRSGSGKKGRIADLTGGLGVDSWAFSEVAEEVIYNEMNPELAAAVRHNFKVLGANNITVRNFEATSENIKSILCDTGAASGTIKAVHCDTEATPETSKRILSGSESEAENAQGQKDISGGFRPDIIFLDPARRDSAGKKVFLLEDCTPDVLKMLPGLFEESRFILLKLSPMADITMAVERLDRSYESFLEDTSGDGWNGQWVREIHIVASGGECKELLILMDREWKGGYSLICREDGKTLTFSQEEIATAKAAYPDSTFARIIFEPGKSLTKAGAFNALCGRFGLTKLARFTHLYTIGEPLSDSELQERIKRLKDFGKIYLVKEILPLSKASMKEVGRRYPHSEVSAKNIPMTSDELRRRLKVSSGDDAHIFGARIETPYSEDNYLIITDKQA